MEDAAPAPLEQLAALTRPKPRDLTTFTLQHDCLCVSCGYNLRMLRSDGKCPECGGPVAAALRGRGLHYAKPQWVRRLALGATLMAIAPLWYLLQAFVTVYVGTQLQSDLALTIVLGALNLPVLVYVVGVFVASGPDGRETPLEVRWRRATRWASAIILGLAVGASGLLILGQSGSVALKFYGDDFAVMTFITQMTVLPVGIMWLRILLRRTLRRTLIEYAYLPGVLVPVGAAALMAVIGWTSVGAGLVCLALPTFPLALLACWILLIRAAGELHRIKAYAEASAKYADVSF